MGLTQRALARRSGVAQPDISDIERGDPAINPTLDKLSALAHALGTTVADLLTI
jgi:transcriptional regulator with XRE-family HTH domain